MNVRSKKNNNLETITLAKTFASVIMREGINNNDSITVEVFTGNQKANPQSTGASGHRLIGLVIKHGKAVKIEKNTVCRNR